MHWLNPEQARIVADRERVSFNAHGLFIDIRNAHWRLRDGGENLSVEELVELGGQVETPMA